MLAWYGKPNSVTPKANANEEKQTVSVVLGALLGSPRLTAFEEKRLSLPVNPNTALCGVFMDTKFKQIFQKGQKKLLHVSTHTQNFFLTLTSWSLFYHAYES